MLIADAHLDLAYNALRGRNLSLPASQQPAIHDRTPETATVGLPDLQQAGVGLVCGTIYCTPQSGERPGYVDHAGAFAQAGDQLAIYQRLWDQGRLRLVRSPADLPGSQAPTPEALAMILLIEGADAVALSSESDSASAAAWFDAGARMIGLAWGGTRYAGGTGAPGPLTAEGRRLVSELDAAGFVHDASHLAESSLDDLLGLGQRPICASHSNCRAIVGEDPRGRHLADRHIRAITDRGGVIGIVLYDRFLLTPAELAKRRAGWSDVVRHIDHVSQLTGDCLHVGIGSDLDGGFGRENVPHELTSIADLPGLADALSAAGFGDEDVRRVMGANWLSFFRLALPDTVR